MTERVLDSGCAADHAGVVRWLRAATWFTHPRLLELDVPRALGILRVDPLPCQHPQIVGGDPAYRRAP